MTAVLASGEGATRALARHAAGLTYDALPPALVDLVKQCVLDTIGVAIGASTLAPEAVLVKDFVLEQGGKAEATLLGFGGKVPAALAAFVNGGLGHMLDYDDIGDGGHMSIATIPVAFALAEKLGHVDGRAFLAAVAAGTDLHVRLDQAIDIPDWTIAEGWFATQLFGYLSGAATAGSLLQLDAQQMESALGIGFNQMAGSRQMAVGAATHMRAMQAGFCGQASVIAADLARRGIIGCKDVIEGRYGLFNTYVRTRTPRWNALVGELGARYPLLQTHGFKVWPACAYTRATNAAALELLRQGLQPQDIERVAIIGGTGGTKLLSEPIESKRRPKTSIDGKYSVPFTTAVMLAKGNVGLRDYTEEGLRDPAVLAMADRITYRDDPAGSTSSGLSSDYGGRPIVEVVTRDGRRLSAQPDGVPGDPQHPVGWPELEAKFRDCVSFSKLPIAATDVDRAIDAIRNLEALDDVADVVRLLVHH